jgi:hypothetical protein
MRVFDAGFFTLSRVLLASMAVVNFMKKPHVAGGGGFCSANYDHPKASVARDRKLHGVVRELPMHTV